MNEDFAKELLSREKFYHFDTVTFHKMYSDIARRNLAEFEVPLTPAELVAVRHSHSFISLVSRNLPPSLKLKENIVTHRLGWFNLNSFAIKIEPSLESLELALKQAFFQPLADLEKLQRLSFGCK